MYVATGLDILYRGGSPQEKQLPHLLSYFGVIVVYYFGVKVLLLTAGSSANRIFGTAAISYLLVVLFSYFEFTGKTYLDIDVDAYIPRVFDDEYNPTQGGLLIRPRGFASESGNFALYLEIMMPILAGHYWSTGRTFRASLVVAIGTIALILTLSAAAFVALPLALVVALFLRRLICQAKGQATRIPALILLALVPTLVAVIAAQYLDTEVLHGIYDKMTFVEEGSARDRLGRWIEALDRISDNPLLGAGAGGFLEEGALRFGVINWWLQILLESGVLGFLLLSAFLAHAFIIAVRVHQNPGFAIAILAASLHYVVISDYWLPWLWFAIACTVVGSGDRAAVYLESSGVNGNNIAYAESTPASVHHQ
jgi:O-antigen ligase/polysaccharide polymerase Wzy-like membrane protein